MSMNNAGNQRTYWEFAIPIRNISITYRTKNILFLHDRSTKLTPLSFRRNHA